MASRAMKGDAMAPWDLWETLADVVQKNGSLAKKLNHCCCCARFFWGTPLRIHVKQREVRWPEKEGLVGRWLPSSTAPICHSGLGISAGNCREEARSCSSDPTGTQSVGYMLGQVGAGRGTLLSQADQSARPHSQCLENPFNLSSWMFHLFKLCRA